MAESQGALPAAQVLTKEESAEGTKTAFQKNKALFYSLRILRELVPSLTIAVSVATFFTAIFTDFMQDSYGMRLMSPVKSSALDKIVAHYMIISRPNATDPKLCTSMARTGHGWAATIGRTRRPTTGGA